MTLAALTEAVNNSDMDYDVKTDLVRMIKDSYEGGDEPWHGYEDDWCTCSVCEKDRKRK